MPQGKGTYGSKLGRPKKKKKTPPKTGLQKLNDSWKRMPGARASRRKS